MDEFWMLNRKVLCEKMTVARGNDHKFAELFAVAFFLLVIILGRRVQVDFVVLLKGFVKRFCLKTDGSGLIDKVGVAVADTIPKQTRVRAR